MDKETKPSKLLEGVSIWASFYRANPHRFVKDYLDINLKIFQMILLFMMNYSTNFIYLASRGQGKSFLTAIFCVVRCILYPGTKICIASKNRQQASEIIEKINDCKKKSQNLNREILNLSLNPNNSYVDFKNTSTIKVVTANDGSRHNRANILVIDEFRMVDENIIATVLQKFLTSERHPKYLDKPEYEHLKERNKEIYMSSAFFKNHWSWSKVRGYCANLVNDTKKYFICALPYQLSIKEDLLSREKVEDEMSEENFNFVVWTMEMECLFFGESEGSFFSYDELVELRTISNVYYPNYILNDMQGFKYKNPEKKNGEIRFVVADIAVMGSKKYKNDATSIHVFQLIPTSDCQYIRNVIYTENLDGGHSETQAMVIRRIFNDLKCDYIVLDTNGVGNGVYDYLVTDMINPDTGEQFNGITCMNDDEMASRYKGSDPRPEKIIYSIKASKNSNSEFAFKLKDALMRKKIRLPISEMDADYMLKESRMFRSLSAEDKTTLLLPYVNTTLIINEIVNLEHEVIGKFIKINEKGSARKDRYSALSYGNYFASELEQKLFKKKKQMESDKNMFHYRAPVLRKR